MKRHPSAALAPGSVKRRDGSGDLHCVNLADLSDEVLCAGLPVEPFHAWPGQRQRLGGWWSSSLRRHVPTSSGSERDLLLRLDHLGDVVAIGWRPFALPGPSVVPSYLALRRLRSTVLAITATRNHCGDALAGVAQDRGWSVVTPDGIDAVSLGNLRWLAAYRVDRYAPSPALRLRLRAACASWVTIENALGRLVDQNESREGALGGILHLLWAHELELEDMTSKPISMRSCVRTVKEF